MTTLDEADDLFTLQQVHALNRCFFFVPLTFLVERFFYGGEHKACEPQELFDDLQKLSKTTTTKCLQDLSLINANYTKEVLGTDDESI